jgi:hypothetical protein
MSPATVRVAAMTIWRGSPLSNGKPDGQEMATARPIIIPRWHPGPNGSGGVFLCADWLGRPATHSGVLR